MQSLHSPLLHRCSTRAASLLHPCCIVPASFLHPCSTRAASLLHPCCIVPASMLTHACIPLHRCLRMLAFACIDACICLHPPASMLAPALHRFCIRLHRTEPTKGEARRLVRFSDQRIESTCETCDDTRGARTRAHPRPSSVPPSFFRRLLVFAHPSPVPPPSSFVPSSPALSSARPSSVLLRSFVAFSSFPVPVSLSPWSGALLVS